MNRFIVLPLVLLVCPTLSAMHQPGAPQSSENQRLVLAAALNETMVVSNKYQEFYQQQIALKQQEAELYKQEQELQAQQEKIKQQKEQHELSLKRNEEKLALIRQVQDQKLKQKAEQLLAISLATEEAKDESKKQAQIAQEKEQAAQKFCEKRKQMEQDYEKALQLSKATTTDSTIASIAITKDTPSNAQETTSASGLAQSNTESTVKPAKKSGFWSLFGL